MEFILFKLHGLLDLQKINVVTRQHKQDIR